MRKALISLTVLTGLALSAFFISPSNSTPQSAQVPQQENLRYASAHLTQMRFEAPMTLDFAGEAVPMELEPVRLKLQKELNQKIKHTAGTRQLYRRVMRYEHLFKKILTEEGIPTDFFYLSMAESALSNAISPVGAAGFWQFMPATGRAYDLKINASVDERFHPVKATYAATRYFKDLYQELHSWTLVAAAYNMGASGLKRAMRRQNNTSYYTLELNRETSQYLYRILSNKCIVEQPGRYGYDLKTITPYSPLRFEYVKVGEVRTDLATLASRKGFSLDQLMTVNPWFQSTTLSAGQTTRIRIPLSEDFYAAELKVKDWSREVVNTDPPSAILDSEKALPDTIHREAAS